MMTTLCMKYCTKWFVGCNWKFLSVRVWPVYRSVTEIDSMLCGRASVQFIVFFMPEAKIILGPLKWNLPEKSLANTNNFRFCGAHTSVVKKLIVKWGWKCKYWNLLQRTLGNSHNFLLHGAHTSVVPAAIASFRTMLTRLCHVDNIPFSYNPLIIYMYIYQFGRYNGIRIYWIAGVQNWLPPRNESSAHTIESILGVCCSIFMHVCYGQNVIYERDFGINGIPNKIHCQLLPLKLDYVVWTEYKTRPC